LESVSNTHNFTTSVGGGSIYIQSENFGNDYLFDIKVLEWQN